MNLKRSMQVMRGFALAAMMLVLLGVGLRVSAQTEATDIAALGVQLWPDYDEPSMLVLLTGSLAPTTALPATVTIPVAPGADINAVARFTTDNQLLSDVVYTVEGDQLTMTLPDLRFQVEYYAPYNIDGDQRSYTFDWLAGLSVAQLSAAVQQPLAAETITIIPEPVNVSSDRGDGLQYHSLASQAVAAGELFNIDVAYTTSTGALSAPALAAGAPAAGSTAAVSSTPVETGRFFDAVDPLWFLLLLAGVALVGLAWYFSRQQRSASRTRKPAAKRAAKPQPQPSRPATPPPTASAPRQPPSASASVAPPTATSATPRFCHQCGEPVVEGDKFCRNCGTPLKSAA